MAITIIQGPDKVFVNFFGACIILFRNVTDNGVHGLALIVPFLAFLDFLGRHSSLGKVNVA